MATKKQVEDAIFEREGFRVELELFEGKKHVLPPYEWKLMAPQRWKISDWKNTRLEPYRLLVKGALVLRGDATPVLRDMQLGNLRDTYYEAEYGAITPEAAEQKIIDLSERRKAGSNRHARRR